MLGCRLAFLKLEKASGSPKSVLMQKHLEVLPPETIRMQMQVTASSIIENLPSLTGCEGWDAVVCHRLQKNPFTFLLQYIFHFFPWLSV